MAISPVLVWNKTTVFDIYSGARAANKTGNAVSTGININYSRTIYKNLFVKIGAGYLKQKFGIKRGFDFEETRFVTRLFYTTKYYAYDCLNYFGGIGYNKSFSKINSKILPNNSEIRLIAIYNFFNTYKQEFKHDFNNDLFGNLNPQIRIENYYLGNSLVLEAGIYRPIGKQFKVGLDILFPVYNKWRKDKIFKEDMNEFYGSGFSMGSSINFIYHINKKN